MDRPEGIFLPKLPMPPSSNHQYFLARRGSKTYHVPSDDLKAFKKEMEIYPLKIGQAFGFIKEQVHIWLDDFKLLEVKAIFYFQHSRIYTKDNRIKRLDVSNRIKALHDCLSKMLDVDDSYFFSFSADKKESLTDLDHVYVEILPIITQNSL